jgi:hypothetical protein
MPDVDTDISTSFRGEPGTYTLRAAHPGFRAVQTTVEMKSRRNRPILDVLKPLVITMRSQ